MSLPNDPNLRVGDAERRAVVDALQKHFAEGRLDIHEFEERSRQAHAARTFGELQPLLSDLPALPGMPPVLSPIPPRPALPAAPARPEDIKDQVKRVTSLALSRAEQRMADKQRKDREKAIRRVEREQRRLARGDTSAQRQLATMSVVSLFLVGVWAATGGGAFWPIWPILVFAFVWGLRFARRL